MKTYVGILIIVAFMVLPFSSLGSNHSGDPLESPIHEIENPEKQTDSTKDWEEKTMASLTDQEYYPSLQTNEVDEKSVWNLTNRANNLRASINETGWHMKAHTKTPGQSSSEWDWHYQAQSLGRDSHINDFPELAFSEISSQNDILTLPRGEIVDEWFKNSKRGMEHGFNISEKIQGNGKLRLTGLLDTDLDIDFNENNLAFQENGRNIFEYTKLHVFDSTDKKLPAKFILNSSGEKHELIIEVDDQNAIYPIVIDPITISQDVNWQAENEQANVMFGKCASAGDVNGDGYDDVIIGAEGYTLEVDQEGIALLWYGSAEGMGDTGTIDNADWTARGDLVNADFGSSVASAGDVNGDGYDDIIIGADNYEVDPNYEGQVFVWYGSATGLGDDGTPANADWYAESEMHCSYLGYSVASTGDVNGDGYDDVIVGAAGHSFAYLWSTEGGAFVWYGSADGLGGDGTVTGADWHATSNQEDSRFGAEVSSTGDINGDGYDDIIIACADYTDTEDREGATFVWYGSATGLGDDGTPANADWHAESDQVTGWLQNVGNPGDINGDGYDDILVGSTGYSDDYSSQGAAFVWYSSATGPGDDGTPANADWKVIGPHASASMGASLAGADINNDGYSDIIVSCRGYNNDYSEAGAVLSWFGSGTGLGEDGTMSNADWKVEGTFAGQKLGRTISNAGDINGDGYSDVMLSEIGYVWLGAGYGTTFLYYGGMENPVTTSSFSPANGSSEIAEDIDLIITFPEVVDIESGNLIVKKNSDDSVVATIDLGSDQVTGSGTDTITVDTGVTLSGSTDYHILIDADALKNIGGYNYPGITDSNTWSFTTDATAPTTTATPAGGTYTSNQTVTLQTDDSEATIYYTIDDVTPSTNSAVYSEPLLINTSTTLKFFAKDLAGNEETVKTEDYILNFPDPIYPGSIATMPGIGGESQLRTFNYLGTPLYQPGTYLYDQSRRTGFNIASGDLNGDGRAELVVAPAKGAAPQIRILNYQGQAQFVPGFYAYEKSMTCGVDVATGDLNGDGRDEIITIPGEGCPAQVRIFDYRGKPILHPGFYAYDRVTKAGFRIAAGDLNNDGKAEIITIPEKNVPAHVRIFDYNGNPRFVPGFYAYGDLHIGGDVGVADLNNDGHAEIITVPGNGNPAYVRIFNFLGHAVLNPGFYAYDRNIKTGFHVAGGDLNDDGRAEIVTAPRSGAAAQIRIFGYDGKTKFTPGFYAYGEWLPVGADVAAGGF